MGSFILCSTPLHGHTAPMLEIGRRLAGRGHRVRVLTGSRFEKAIVDAGMEFAPLPMEFDLGDADLNDIFPERSHMNLLDGTRFDLYRFISGTTFGYRALRELVSDGDVDAVAFEAGFMGAVPLMLRPAGERPRTYAIGVMPYFFPSRDTAPFGLGLMPSSSPLGRVRNVGLGLFMKHVVMGPVQKRFVELVHRCDTSVDPPFLADCAALADAVLWLSTPSFEYECSDRPAHFRLVGPILPGAPATFDPPDWWGDLDSGKPIVHVTQGTLDNTDLGRLIAPTLQALADEDVMVVAATGGAPLESIPGTIPSNARVTRFIPYSELLPRVDVMVTNGGYGGVHNALSYGLPLVVAGDREDKPEVANRVARAGAGINLKTGQPKPDAVRKAVRTILAEPVYKKCASAIAAEIAQSSALDTITDELENGRPRTA